MTFRLVGGDAIQTMQAMDENSVDAIVTDPPYGLEFMGKEWDRLGDVRQPGDVTFTDVDNPYGRSKVRYGYDVPLAAMQEWHHGWATEALRILKPGGHLLAFGGTRTYHRLACAIEDAGFEIRDCIAWMYGSGFPKSLDVSKAIDKARDDRPDVLRVTAEIARLRDAAHLTNTDLDGLFGFAGMAGHWTSVQSQPAVPTVEQWGKLREVLHPAEWMDAEVWRLNGRKGTPGENWAMREVVGTDRSGPASVAFVRETSTEFDITAPATPEAQRWNGWGSALKPCFEPVVLARKPLSERNVAANVLRWGTGALNIGATRVEAVGVSDTGGRMDAWEPDVSLCDSCAEAAANPEKPPARATRASTTRRRAGRSPNGTGQASLLDTARTATGCSDGTKAGATATSSSIGESGSKPTGRSLTATSSTTSTTTEATTGWTTCASCGVEITQPTTMPNAGRWTPNVTLDESAAAMLDEQTGELTTNPGIYREDKQAGDKGWGMRGRKGHVASLGDTGGASRFFYCPKADREERNRGLEHMAQRSVGIKNDSGRGFSETDPYRDIRAANHHPTVKPVELMRWLCRMVTPKGGTVLDPFTGSGSTGVAAMREGFEFIGIEREAEYVEIARARIFGDQPLFNVEGGGPTE